jgi:transposase
MNDSFLDHVERTEEHLHQQGTGKVASSLHPRLAWMLCYEETGSAQEVCRKFGISRKTFYKWLKRYQTSKGDSTSLTDRSRRPHTFPKATPESSIQLLKRVREETGFGQRRLKNYLAEKHNIRLSERTIWKILKRLEAARESRERTQTQVGPDGVIFSSDV